MHVPDFCEVKQTIAVFVGFHGMTFYLFVLPVSPFCFGISGGFFCTYFSVANLVLFVILLVAGRMDGKEPGKHILASHYLPEKPLHSAVTFFLVTREYIIAIQNESLQLYFCGLFFSCTWLAVHE